MHESRGDHCISRADERSGVLLESHRNYLMNGKIDKLYHECVIRKYGVKFCPFLSEIVFNNYTGHPALALEFA